MERVKFIDGVSLYLKAGDGGEGSSAKRRFRGHFLNWGGDGGDGGSIYIEADSNVFDLSKFLNKRKFFAKNGGGGLANNKKGRDAEDLILKVPRGTLVKDREGKVLFDLVNSKQRVLIVEGGEGGKGNFKRKSTLQASQGQEAQILLDFRIPADVVLLGATNVGKSTLLSKITNLKPKISEFPFTTKIPLWGVVKKDYKAFTILELPAIIGKKNQQAEGIKFLKHIKRAKLLVFLVDGEKGFYQEQIDSLKKVLVEKKTDYSDKYILIVLNKIDKIDKNIDSEFIKISAKEYYGLDKFIDRIFYHLGR